MLWTRRTISELDSPTHINFVSLRPRIRLLIIDDDDFPYMECLRRHGYSPTHVKDIDNIIDVEPYEIILCDIQGVGKKFGSRFEGAHLISEIKKKLSVQNCNRILWSSI